MNQHHDKNSIETWLEEIGARARLAPAPVIDIRSRVLGSMVTVSRRQPLAEWMAAGFATCAAAAAILIATLAWQSASGAVDPLLVFCDPPSVVMR